MESSHEILEKIAKAAQLIRANGDAETFKKNFSKIKELVEAIPGHEELVIVNDLSKIESWQIQELQTTLLEQLTNWMNT